MPGRSSEKKMKGSVAKRECKTMPQFCRNVKEKRDGQQGSYIHPWYDGSNTFSGLHFYFVASISRSFYPVCSLFLGKKPT